jgi:hypothetical protein
MAFLEFDTFPIYEKLYGFWTLKSSDHKQINEELIIFLKLNQPNPMFNFNGKYTEQIIVSGKSVKKKVVPICFEYFHIFEQLKIKYLNEKAEEIFRIQILNDTKMILQEVNSKELFEFEREN